MKTCKKCNGLKNESEYYANDNSCKECRKAKVRANRAEKIDYYREFDRQRANRPERVKARAEYAKTEHGKLIMLKAKNDWSIRNAYKRKAHQAVNNAVRDGLLEKGACEVCGTTEGRIEGHHDDYSKPLDVRWLCTAHHAEHHKNEREKRRTTWT